ncbi:MAG: dTMP kinase [Pseudonocardiaceae bacterium]
MLISFEGLPGAGKSTQVALLTACLTHRGLPTVTLPDLATLDTDPVAATLIELFASSGDPYLRNGDAVTDTLLAAAIRADIVATRLDPALRPPQDQVVIEDRGIHTMQSYALAGLLRDHRANIDLAVGWTQTLAALTGQQTGHALWLRLPVNEALRRASHRDQRAPTSEQRSYLQWVHEAYTELAQRDPQLTVLDVGTLQPAEVHQAVHLALRELGLNLAGTDTTNGRCAGLPHVAGGPA